MGKTQQATNLATPTLAEHVEVSAQDLRRLWEGRQGSPPPRTLSSRIMRIALAWYIQAELHGGETRQSHRQWTAVMRRRAGGAGPEEALRGLIARPTSAGMRLLKAWGGETHEVIVGEDGVTWNGRTYSSLSAVAKAMTGIPRNGPKFFGLREDTR